MSHLPDSYITDFSKIMLTVRDLNSPVDDSSKKTEYLDAPDLYAQCQDSLGLSTAPWFLTCGMFCWFKTCHRNHRSFLVLLRTRNMAAMAYSSGRPLGNILLWEENRRIVGKLKKARKENLGMKFYIAQYLVIFFSTNLRFIMHFYSNLLSRCMKATCLCNCNFCFFSLFYIFWYDTVKLGVYKSKRVGHSATL